MPYIPFSGVTNLPLNSETVTSPWTIERDRVLGPVYSINTIGGYMEVFKIEDLKFTVEGTGSIQSSGNTIPINYTKRTLPFLNDTLVLNNDNLSSGRRRLGMLVYVHETDKVYQYTIPDYESLWSGASGSLNVSETQTTVSTSTTGGEDFINAWLDNSIEGVSGATQFNSRWRVFWGTDWQVTGGTIDYNSTGDLSLNSNSGNTVTISGLTTITGGTYLSGTSTLELYNNLGDTVSITGFTSGGSVSVSGNTGLGIVNSDTLFTIYNSNLSSDLEMGENVGGIEAGTTVSDLTGKTMVELFNDLLFPTILPTYSNPTISFNGSPSTQTVEIGDEVTVNFNGVGTKNDAGEFTVIRARKNNSVVQTDNTPTEGSATDVPDQFGFVNPNNPNHTYTSTSYTETLTVPAPTGGSTSTTTTYDVNGDYNAGLVKKDNKGEDDDRSFSVRNTNRPQAASTNFDSSNRTITGIYPYFWGVSSTEPTVSSVAAEISAGTANKVLSSASGTITVTFNASSEFLWFAHFTNYTSKTAWFVDSQNSGSIGGDSNLFNTPTETSVDSPDGYWSGINFEIYLGNYQTTTTGSMQLRNS